MGNLSGQREARRIASEFDAEMRALPLDRASYRRTVRRKYSQLLKDADGALVLQVVGELVHGHGYRGTAYELVKFHTGAFRSLGQAELEDLGRGINSWWAVDGFARTLSGPAWRDGLIGDEVIHGWSRSDDLWWRRAALVSTVALNVRSHGGKGDVPRTLAVCRMLVDDHEDMVVKAMSWALRELVVHDAKAVRDFLAEYEDRLAARAKREVRNKLETGLKTPRRKA